MEYYLKLEDLGFGMASPLVYSKALKKSGFVAIKTNNRNKWYKDEARRELEILSGPSRKSYEDITSKGFIENQINWHHKVPGEDEYGRAISELNEKLNSYE